MAKRRNQIAGQFVSRPRQLVESSAMRVLSLAAHQALMRIEVEHMSHGGVENGKLPVTYRQLEKWGVRRHSVASGVRELVALGIIEITRRGYSGAADMPLPADLSPGVECQGYWHPRIPKDRLSRASRGSRSRVR